jgi:agmatine deiminase
MHRRRFVKTGAGALAAVLALPAAAQNPMAHRVPPEEARHEATFMQWPVTREVYDNHRFREDVQDTILRLANAIAAFEPVILLADAQHHGDLAGRVSADVELWDIPSDDLWARDAGPLFTALSGGGQAISHIRFNGWGNRQGHHNDGRIAERVAERLDLPLIESGLVGEPGGVETDGHGLLMAHVSSWLQENRNPGLSLEEIGTRLMAAYGAERIIWAPGAAGLDITDYHIDSLARFTGPGRVLINLPPDPDPGDPFQAAALETQGILEAEGLEIEVIDEPRRPRVRSRDFVASYVNYYVCNGAVMLAEFGDRDADDAASEAIARAYPDRELVTLNVDALGELGGGIHCATQQWPAA